MPRLPDALYSAEQARGLDRRAIEQLEIPGNVLMERAGEAAWRVLVEYWPAARNVVVLCGGGNNGGDGYVLARRAAEEGRAPSVVALVDPAELKGDARTAAERYRATARPLVPWSDEALAGADVIVDGMLGTGIDRDAAGVFARAIAAVNAAGRPVLALDVPSGLNADSGCVMGDAVRAHATVTFIALKTGLFTGAGAACGGIIHLAGLDLPPDLFRDMRPAARRMDHDNSRALLAPRLRDAHKGHFGHVLVIGGNYGFAGAVRLAGEAAARVGSGLVSIATRPEHAVAIPIARPELMAHAVAGPSDLSALLERATVVAAGPGLGTDEWGVRLLARVLECPLPLVLDADALNLLALEPRAREDWVLTPHPGEAARMLDCPPAAIQQDRIGAAARLQQRYGGVTVLKGSGTVVCSRTEPPAVCSDGNPGMASGGMGDVLTGVIAGLRAQRLDAWQAACLGVCLHAAAADRAAPFGERGMLAGDLMPWLRQLANPD